MVPGAGLEPARPLRRGILNPLCLPIPPPGQNGGGSRSRTEVHGFAIRCIATLPTRLFINKLVMYFPEKIGAANETRTRDIHVGNVMLYQLSYSRFPVLTPCQRMSILHRIYYESTVKFHFSTDWLNNS